MKKPTEKSALDGMIRSLSLKTKASIQLNKLLTRTHLEGNTGTLSPVPFSIEKTDLHQSEFISDGQKKVIQSIV